jgi:hypothetical protein
VASVRRNIGDMLPKPDVRTRAVVSGKRIRTFGPD